MCRSRIDRSLSSAKKVAGCWLLASLAALPLHGAEPYPNPHKITRYIDAETDVTVQNVVNNGTIWKRGDGTATLPAPALNGGGALNVAEGDVVLDLDAEPAVPTLPDYLTAKIKLWLDPGVNVVAADGLVTKWLDRREEDVTAAADALVHPYATSEFHWMRPVPTDDRRPSLVTGSAALKGACLDFGSYGTAGCKWLCITNTGRSGGYVYAREVFTVCARRSDSTAYGFVMFSTCRGDANNNRPTPSWTGASARLWGSTENTRADKGSTRLDRNVVWGGCLPIQDFDWHVVSTAVPNGDSDCIFNQIGLDRDLTQYSGGFCLAEVIVFEQRLSEFDRMRVEDYLWKKWIGSRQTSVGSLAIAAGSTVTADTSSDVAGSVTGGGDFVKTGPGTVTLVDDGFSGEVELAEGALRSEGLPLAIKTGGQTLAAGAQGVVTRTDGAAANVVAKTGAGQLTAASLPADVKVQVSSGRLRLSPPPESSEDILSPAIFTNANFEAFSVLPGKSLNVGGGGGTSVAQTNRNWVFDRSMHAKGGNLVTILATNTYHDTGSSWDLQPEDTYGLGYEGTNMLYIYRGSATGRFILPAAGFYRLSFAVGARSRALKEGVKLKIDGEEIREVMSFNEKSFMRCEVSLPFLAAGPHEVTVCDLAGTDNTILFDDFKVFPVRCLAEAPVSVAISNPGFEEPMSNIASLDYGFIPSVADCTGWTVPEESNNSFVNGMIVRRWFDGVTDIAKGFAALPDEMADGFLCAQLYQDKEFSQTVTLPSAGRYRLVFHLAKRCGLSPQLVRVTVGDKVVKKVWVRHDDWKEYEAVFDVEEGGEKTLSFAGEVLVSGNNVYTGGSAWLDDIAMERISGTVPENLVANGGFETVGGGWTYHGFCTNASATSWQWIANITNAPPQGADCAFLGGKGNADASLRQQVAFPAAGRYELSFRVKRYRANPFGDDDQPTQFYVMLGDDRIWHSYVLRHEDECVIRQPFTVAAEGTYLLDFHTAFTGAARAQVLIDDVEIVAAPAAARTDLADYIPETLELEVASGATLDLDFDGVAEVRRVTYGGKAISGDISHATYPAWVMGRGVLHAMPRGTVFVLR